jgi:hypothetical protein
MDILDPRTPVKNTILLYILITLFILHTRPSFIFTHHGRCETFGFCKKQNENKNILTLVMTITSILSYFTFLIINLLYNKTI